MLESRLLKKDLFGEVRLEIVGGEARIVRDAGPARLWLRWLARFLMRREAKVLAALDGIEGVPGLVSAAYSRWWMRLVKPPYLFITRRVLGWSDREGAADRGERR